MNTCSDPWSQTPRYSRLCIIRLLLAALAVSATANSAVLSAPAGDSGEWQVRPGSEPLWADAQASLEKIRSRTERLVMRAAKGDELKGKSESLRKEVVEIYRLIRSVELAGDDLLLRGERDGEGLRESAVELAAALDAAVTSLRPYLGSPSGLANAATRRAKEQLGAIKQLDELIKQRQWTTAHEKLQALLEAADEVGRFPEPADAEPIFRPLLERLPVVRAGYLTEKKVTVVPILREEFAATRPALDELRKQLASTSDSARNMRQLHWADRPLNGPEILSQIADEWPETDAAVLKAAAVLHAIGSPAESELGLLQSEYEAARVEAVTLVRNLILADARSSEAAVAESHHARYVAAIPRFMTALRASPESTLGLSAALNQLAQKSPSLESKVRAYRAATHDAVRWRRRVALRYQRKFHEQHPATPLAELIERPPAHANQPAGAPALPGQEVPVGQRRKTDMAWRINDSPESVAARWIEQWKDTPARIQGTTAQWASSGDPILLSAWQRRAKAEVDCARQTLLGPIERLTKDLLLAPNRAPVTLEAALAVHTAAHGPFTALGATLRGPVVDNLPDRLFDSHDPTDISGALAPSTLVAYPAMPALVRIQFKLDWLVHELFAELILVPQGTSPSPAPPQAPSAPIATQSSEPPSEVPSSTTTRPDGPRISADSPASANPGATRPAIKKGTPSQPPPGGVRF